MKKSLILVLFIFYVTFVHASDWTIFVYMAADNGLHSTAIDDIIEMQKGLQIASNKPNIIVFIDHVPNYKNGIVEYLQIKPSNKDYIDSKILKSYPDMDSGSGETLLSFLNWGYPKYKSKHNCLVIWSHGEGWVRSGDSIFGICPDASSGSMIGVSTGELRNVFLRHRKKYDIIIFDACFAGSLELLSEINEYADFILGSPSEFPIKGYPWIEILPSWILKQTPFQTIGLVTEKFRDAYRLGGIYNPNWISDMRVSVSVYDMDKYSDLLQALKGFSVIFSNPLYLKDFSDIRNSQEVLEYNSMYGYIDVDLLSFIEKLKKDIEHLPFINDLLDELDNILNDFVIKNVTLNSIYNHNLSIFYPKDLNTFLLTYENYWYTLQLKNSDWARFLNYCYGEDITPPKPVTELEYLINLETIYIDWNEPIDPCPLKYQILFYNEERGFIKKSEILDKSKYHTSITDSGFFIINTIDEVGNTSSSNIQNFFFSEVEEQLFYVAPNPIRTADTKITVFFYLINSNEFVKLSIYDISGQLKWERVFYDLDKGEQRVEIEKDKYASGMYFAILRTSKSKMTSKFSIIK